jgi:hypothetical protein
MYAQRALPGKITTNTKRGKYHETCPDNTHYDFFDAVERFGRTCRCLCAGRVSSRLRRTQWSGGYQKTRGRRTKTRCSRAAQTRGRYSSTPSLQMDKWGSNLPVVK